ncbi:MAG: phasin family protein [Chloroflexota bacterium]|nr:phasin family protein [Chloroflexota bacterium]
MEEQTKETTEIISDEEKAASNGHTGVALSTSSMTAAVRKVLLAGVGAVALSRDEIEDFVARLVDRGGIAEQDGRKLVNDVLARRRQQAEEIQDTVEEKGSQAQTKTESMVDQSIENVLTRLNVPSKSDIDALSQKITLLAEKVDALKDA